MSSSQPALEKHTQASSPHDPSSAGFLERLAPEHQSQIESAVLLGDFLQNEQLKPGTSLTLEDRQLVVEQAILLLDRVYVHLHLKRAMYAIDPIQRLKLLQYRLNQQAAAANLPSDLYFHTELLSIFNSLRDLHTKYILPADRFGRKQAILPFTIEECCQAGEQGALRQKFILSKVFPGFETPLFEPGVEILHWNGTPIRRAIELNADRQAGSNPAARFVQGLASLTNRPMISSIPPDEEWVVVGFRSKGGEYCEHRQEWVVITLKENAPAVDQQFDAGLNTSLALEVQSEAVAEVNKLFYAASSGKAAASAKELTARPSAISSEWVETNLQGVFRARKVITPYGEFAYIRIFTFHVSHAESFIREFIRLLGKLPQEGLILDIRSNPGGNIHASEQLLQVLTPREIEPERVEFIISPLTLELCKRHRLSPKSPFDPPDLSFWEPSIREAGLTGATYSRAYPISDREQCNTIGQQYFGPVILITDAKTYSAADIFAAGFQDHEVGEVLGIHRSTGAGGANVWTHADLCSLLPGEISQFKPLPHQAGMHVAVRRSLRVGEKTGMLVEDLGVIPDHIHETTENDLLNGNEDLILHAACLLQSQPARQLQVDGKFSDDESSLQLEVSSKGMDRLDVYLDGRPYGSFDIHQPSENIPVQLPASGAQQLEVRGFELGKLVARRRISLS